MLDCVQYIGSIEASLDRLQRKWTINSKHALCRDSMHHTFDLLAIGKGMGGLAMDVVEVAALSHRMQRSQTRGRLAGSSSAGDISLSECKASHAARFQVLIKTPV